MDERIFTDVCTLPTVERPVRLAEFDDVFTDAVRCVQRDGDRAWIRLTGAASLRERVRDLVDRESTCCSFFTFTVAGTEDDIVLGISVPPEHRAILAALTDRAAGLSA